MQARAKFGRFYFVFTLVCSLFVIASEGRATNQAQQQAPAQAQQQACPIVFAPPATPATTAKSPSIQEVLAEFESIRASALEREKSRRNETAMKTRQELIDLGLADE